MNACLWCSRHFEPRPRTAGGKEQRFCSPSCRKACHVAADRWAMGQLERGEVSADTLRGGAEATKTLPPVHKSPLPAITLAPAPDLPAGTTRALGRVPDSPSPATHPP
ncbi:MAG: hypothetical protein EXQ86_12105 [Rhodospirillales bacterium]|nr:hypothetical protein [Rhodospirillales bacterium]